MTDRKPTKAEQEFAAERRADYLRALDEELAGVKAAGKGEDRIKAIEAEIKRVKGAGSRQAPPKDTAS